MALQDVKNDILNEAKEERKEIEKEAEEKADEIIGEAEKKADEIQKEAGKELEKKKEAEKRKKISNARMQARQKKLEAKQDKINEVFDRLRKQLEDLDGEERKNLVENSIREAEFKVGKIQASSDFKKALENLEADFEDSDINGFVLVSDNGERSKNFSIEKIVEDLKEQNRKKAAQKLFGEVNE